MSHTQRFALTGLVVPFALLGAAAPLHAQELFIGSSNTAILKGDAKNGDFQFVSACGGQVNSMVLSGDTLHVGDSNGNVYIYDDAQQSISYAFTLATDATSMTRDATSVFVGGTDGNVFRVHPLTGAIQETFPNFFSIDAMLLDGNSLVTGSTTTLFQETLLPSGQSTVLGACGGAVQSMARSGDDLYLGDAIGRIYHYDFAHGFLDYVVQSVPSDLKAMVIDGQHLLVGGTNGNLLRVDRVTGEVLATTSIGMPIEAMAIGAAAVPEPGTSYCFGLACPCANDDIFAGCKNSTGHGAIVSGAGSRSTTSDDLVLTVKGLPPNVLARFYMSDIQSHTPFADGFLCAGGGGYPAFRFPLNHANLSGVMTQGPGIVQHATTTFGPSGTIHPGATWNFQVWYRNVLGPCGTFLNVSSAYRVSFAP